GYQIKAFLLVSFTHLGSGISSPSLLPCQISDLRWSSNLFDRAQFSRRSLRPIFIQGPRSSPNQRVTWPQDESPEGGRQEITMVQEPLRVTMTYSVRHLPPKPAENIIIWDSRARMQKSTTGG
ncbi:hypothetical protein LINPERHAP2_LOCUS4206, partial [Linum perenne]